MVYRASLGSFHQLAIANLGGQTQVNLTLSRPGQQQSQSSSFTTGQWRAEPKLFQIGQDYILQIDGEQGKYHLLIQQSSISTVEPPPQLDSYSTVELHQTEDSSQNQAGFEPMPPLKMGNMTMDLNSMSMQMGNMSLNLNNQAKTTATKTFCSQCGTKAQPGDRFCRACGHELNQ